MLYSIMRMTHVFRLLALLLLLCYRRFFNLVSQADGRTLGFGFYRSVNKDWRCLIHKNESLTADLHVDVQIANAVK